MDKKGRAVIKEVLEEAGIRTPCMMLASVKPGGIIELKEIGEKLARAQALGTKKFRRWREEDHAGEKLLFKMVKHETDSYYGSHTSMKPHDKRNLNVLNHLVKIKGTK